jgi:hypothetical protein
MTPLLRHVERLERIVALLTAINRATTEHEMNRLLERLKIEIRLKNEQP